MQKMYPYLWFDKNLKEITDFYCSVFPDAKLKSNGSISDTPSGEVEMATFEILGQKFGLMTGGPQFKFTEAISFVIECDTQEKVDYYWEKLSFVPEAEACGWCKDRYGLSWQIVPKAFEAMMSTGSKEQIQRVVAAFMSMKKLDIATLQTAYDGV
jgi:predicted 3-demethylubiquinone-9 3-methyltransferase (glyoxalase superfamily)